MSDPEETGEPENEDWPFQKTTLAKKKRESKKKDKDESKTNGRDDPSELNRSETKNTSAKTEKHRPENNLKLGGYPHRTGKQTMQQNDLKLEASISDSRQVSVINAFSGETIGTYSVTPTDLVRDLKDKVARQCNRNRPWTFRGQLLLGTHVLQDEAVIKDSGILDAPELLFVKEHAGQPMLTKDVLVLVPEVIVNTLNPCQVKRFSSMVQWHLDEFVLRPSLPELQADWKQACSRSEENTFWDMEDGQFAPWIQFRPGHMGAKRFHDFVLFCSLRENTMSFCYYAFIHDVPGSGHFDDGEFQPTWHSGAPMSPSLSPSLFPGLRNIRRQSAYTSAEKHLALPCAILALRNAGLEVLEVLSSSHLHGYGLTAIFSLLLSVEAEGGNGSSIIAVNFRALQAPAASKVDVLGKDYDDFFAECIFDALLEAAVLDDCAQVLVLWHSDQSRALRWYLGPVPSAFRNFRQLLVNAWFPADGDKRHEYFNKLARGEFGGDEQNSSSPTLVQLPKDVCVNLWCRSGLDCAKRRHLFTKSVSPPCRRARHTNSCRFHHCGFHEVCAGCAQIWVPQETDVPWTSSQAKPAKGKKCKSRAAESSENTSDDSPLQHVNALVKMLKVSAG